MNFIRFAQSTFFKTISVNRSSAVAASNSNTANPKDHSIDRTKIVVGGLAGTTIMTEMGYAAIIPNGANKQDYINYAIPFLGKTSGTIIKYDKATNQTISSYSAGIKNASWDRPGEASLIDTAAHPSSEIYSFGNTAVPRTVNIDNLNVGYRFVTGNAINNPGISHELKLVHVPAGTDGTFNSVDRLVFQTDIPVTGVARVVDLTTTPAAGTEVLTVGSGYILTLQDIQNNNYVKTGDYAAWNSRISATEPSFINNDFNIFATFNSTNPNVTNIGKIGPDDSGSSVFLRSTLQFDLDGKVIYAERISNGIGQTGNGSTFGYSILTDRNTIQNIGFENYLQNNTSPIVPEPTGILLLALGGLLAVTRRLKNKSAW